MPKKTEQKVEMYNMWWNPIYNPIIREVVMIQKGGKWAKKDGSEAGNGLFFHYRKLQELLWPEDDHHRWSDLMLESILNHTIISIMGSKDSGKTHCALAKFGLTDYFCFPNTTLIMMSSTDLRGLELRVWGALKTLFQRAKEKLDSLPGFIIDTKHAICTQNLQEDEVRDMRKGIICIPCMSTSGGWMGLSSYVGIKQKRRRLLSDEVQLMKASFVESLANLNSGDFKGVFVGNPIGQNDPLDKVAEPLNGWDSISEPTKTTTWENKFENGITINLVGTDSPNFDFPQDQPPRYPYMINQQSIDRVSAFYGKNSSQFYSQCLGVRKVGLDARRVLTKQLCEQFGAFDYAVWADEQRTKVYAVDAAYGGIGGDRCVGGYIEFGIGINGYHIIRVNPPKLIPVSIKSDKQPEQQIAKFCKQECLQEGIPADHVFYDATGRGSLGTWYAREWSPMVNPVEFGGSPSKRPVSADLLIYDESSRIKRLKRCDEHYSKFVTELWFSIRYLVMGRQMFEMPMEVVDDACLREWMLVPGRMGERIEIETKANMKKRTGQSPDFTDWLATALEGARRLGLRVANIANEDFKKSDDQWKQGLRLRAMELRKMGQLIRT